MHAWRKRYLREVLPVSDYLRTYDVAPEFRYASTLHRAAFCLRAAAEVSGECAVLNVEDTALIGAALGCSLGVMRHPGEERMQKLTYNYRPLSETLCALRWQRMAPPFAANRGKTLISEETLRDKLALSRARREPLALRFGRDREAQRAGGHRPEPAAARGARGGRASLRRRIRPSGYGRAVRRGDSAHAAGRAGADAVGGDPRAGNPN